MAAVAAEVNHMEFSIIEGLLNAQEYNDLRESVGWKTYDLAVAEKGLMGSLYGVCAFVNGEIVGMARILGDGGLVYYIQDVIVRPEFQGNGIGSAMMDRIMGYIQAHASQNSIVGLMSARGKEAFYARYGFVQRPNERMGCGMTIFWSGDDREHRRNA